MNNSDKFLKLQAILARSGEENPLELIKGTLIIGGLYIRNSRRVDAHVRAGKVVQMVLPYKAWNETVPDESKTKLFPPFTLHPVGVPEETVGDIEFYASYWFASDMASALADQTEFPVAIHNAYGYEVEVVNPTPLWEDLSEDEKRQRAAEDRADAEEC